MWLGWPLPRLGRGDLLVGGGSSSSGRRVLMQDVEEAWGWGQLQGAPPPPPQPCCELGTHP